MPISRPIFIPFSSRVCKQTLSLRLPQAKQSKAEQSKKGKMEELRKLEQIQRTLSFMQSSGLVTSSCNNSHDSNRFLANLILLLVQPCGKLDMDDKCSLILEHVPKLSSSFLEEVSLWLTQEDSQKNCITSDIVIEENYCDPLLSSNDDVAMVGLDSMQKANSTLEDFCRSYFMFHGMDANSPQDIFKYLPVLSFTESFIYQLDSMNEKIVDIPTNGVTLFERDFENQSSKLMDVVKNDPFRTLVSLLEQHGLLTERIRGEFRYGEEYWALERKLCCALKSNKEISVEEAMRAIHLKSFDYRVLNLLLYQLRGEKVNDLHMGFLSISEFLVEISDDLMMFWRTISTFCACLSEYMDHQQHQPCWQDTSLRLKKSTTI